MILITLGTQDKEFTRLLDLVQEQINKGNIKDKVVVQGGHTKYQSDDMEIKINGISEKTFGSQGQQRSAVLSLKLAQAQMLFEKNGEKPIILLDDVLSELDAKRQDFLLNKVEGYQVFVTCCEESNKEQLKRGKVFYINDGDVR